MTYRRYDVPKDLAAQALAFDPVLPPAGTPDALAADETGRLFLQIQAPGARRVELRVNDQEYTFQRDEDGIWRLPYPCSSGINFVHLVIDGTEVLTPYLPIGYGYSRPCNFVAIAEEDSDWYRLRDVPHGKTVRDYFRSAVTGEWQSCTVYLPPTYDQQPEKTFPVLYLQHGHGENEIGWVTAGKVPFILDNLIAEGKCVPFVVVMNNGMVQRRDSSGNRIVDFKLFDAYLTQDVIPYIESHYHVGGAKQLRAMAGLSMGSLHTSISGLTHPELFSALGIFSGFMHDWIQGSEIDMVQRGPGDDAHLALLQDPERFDREFAVFFRAIGEEDPFLPFFLADDDRCKQAGIRQHRTIYSGSHDWNVWRQCIRDFSVLLFRTI